MSLEFGNERPGDEPVIDRVICRAFESMSEANIVRLLRSQYAAFDPRYSLTVWDGPDLVGHAQFTPARLRLMGRTVPALLLGPIAVLPERQRQGIGGKLLEFGHDLGRRDGFQFVLLAGHPSYYPRHGYRSCYCFPKVAVDADQLPQPTRRFYHLPVTEADLPWLVARHEAEWAGVDFGWLWGPTLSEWTMTAVNAQMWWTEDGRRAAYTIDTPGRGKCRMLLADDPALAREVIATIRPPTLEHHPAGWLVREALAGVPWATPTDVSVHDAAMVRELQPGVLGPYLEAVARGDRLPGSTRWPLPFIAC